jgi:uncharacterized protein
MFRQRLTNDGIDGARLILFGSWAKGKQQELSDIDLCVVSDKFSGNTFVDSTRLRLLTIGIDDLLEPVAMRPEDLDDKYNTLASEVKKWGIVV